MIINPKAFTDGSGEYNHLFELEIAPEQLQAVKEEAKRWGLSNVDVLQFILRWGFLQYFKE